MDVNFQLKLQGWRALPFAVPFNQAHAIDALVEAGADTKLKANDGKTHLELSAESKSGSCETVLALLKCGENVRVQDDSGLTPLHWACRHESPGAFVDIFILPRWWADETALSDRGETPGDLLDDNKGRRSREEVEHARRLLARAPADRQWRRRSW